MSINAALGAMQYLGLQVPTYSSEQVSAARQSGLIPSWARAPWDHILPEGTAPWAEPVYYNGDIYTVSPSKRRQKQTYGTETYGTETTGTETEETDAGRLNKSRQRGRTQRADETVLSLDDTRAVIEDDGTLPEQIVIPQERIRRSDFAAERAVRRRGTRLLPRVSDQAVAEERAETTVRTTPERSWPEQRRVCAENYSAVEIHGFFGLIDDGSDAAGRMLIVHVPKWVRGYFMDIRQGDTLHVYSPDGKRGGRLYVLSTGRHRYYKPGAKVSTCTVCVPEDQWAQFLRFS
jgi:hypothetical protein